MGASSLTVSVPAAAPNAVGANAIKIVHDPPAAKVAGDKAHVPPVCRKLPVTAIELIVSGPLCRFVRVSVLLGLVVPCATFPKASGEGARVTGLMPVPESDTD